MGQEEKKKLYYACKDYGLDVKWNMSEAALRDIHDAFIADRDAEEAKQKKDAEKKAKEVKKADKAKAKKAKADAVAAKKKADEVKKADKASEPEPDIEDNLEDEAEDDPIITFLDEDEDDITIIDDQSVPMPKKKSVVKARKREVILKARYFPKKIKKKSVSENPLEIYNNQMSMAGKQSRANRRKYKRKNNID